MLIKTGYEFVFQVETPSLMLLMVALHPDREHTVCRHNGLVVEPYVPVEEFIDVYGNRCRRIFAPTGRLRLWDEMIVEDSGLPDPVGRGRGSTLPRTYPAIPCSSCSAAGIARWIGSWILPGGCSMECRRAGGEVQAVCNWVNANVRFDYQAAR